GCGKAFGEGLATPEFKPFNSGRVPGVKTPAERSGETRQRNIRRCFGVDTQSDGNHHGLKWAREILSFLETHVSPSLFQGFHLCPARGCIRWFQEKALSLRIFGQSGESYGKICRP